MVGRDGSRFELLVEKQFFYNERGEMSFFIVCFNSYRPRSSTSFLEEINEEDNNIIEANMMGSECEGGIIRAKNSGNGGGGGGMQQQQAEFNIPEPMIMEEEGRRLEEEENELFAQNLPDTFRESFYA